MRKVRAIYKGNKIKLILACLILVFPLIVGLIYYIPIPQIINVDSGDLLSYYGLVFGIFASFITYLSEKNRQAKQKSETIRPRLYIDLTKKGKVFILQVNQVSEKPLKMIYLFDEFASMNLRHEYKICFGKNCKDVKRDIEHDVLNITVDENIIDDDGFPKHIQLCCDDIEGNMWNCMFYKRKNGDKIFFYPDAFELV